nr:DNA-directed RNA polymerase II subunit RPB2 [Tanacetum cinerariifolium]
MMTKSDGETATLFPKAATLRNLTYYAPLYVDVTKRAIKKGHDCEEVIETQDFGKVFIRKVRIMLRSSYCTLFQNSKKDLTELGECPYDQGGYFIINESEKVLISQEKMSTNHVYVFKKRQPNKYAYVGEVRSMTESKNRPPKKTLAETEMLHLSVINSTANFANSTLHIIIITQMDKDLTMIMKDLVHVFMAKRAQWGQNAGRSSEQRRSGIIKNVEVDLWCLGAPSPSFPFALPVAMAAPAGGNKVARRVVDDLIDFSGQTSVKGYMNFFKAQQIAEARLFVNRMREKSVFVVKVDDKYESCMEILLQLLVMFNGASCVDVTQMSGVDYAAWYVHFKELDVYVTAGSLARPYLVYMGPFFILDKLFEVVESPRLADKMKISLSKKRRLVAELEAVGEVEGVAKSLEHMRVIVARDAVTLGELKTLLPRA